MRQASSSVPSSATRPLTTAKGSTQGMSMRLRLRSISYSRCAMSALISLTASTRPDRRTKRTTCREMPRGRAASRSSAHSSSGMRHGRSSRAGSGRAAVISSAMRASLCVREGGASEVALVRVGGAGMPDAVGTRDAPDECSSGASRAVPVPVGRQPMRWPVSLLNTCMWFGFG